MNNFDGVTVEIMGTELTNNAQSCTRSFFWVVLSENMVDQEGADDSGGRGGNWPCSLFDKWH